ncbi:MAG: GldM family protein [Limnohabitans sp.]|nr:GldM family protein [Limnohabitans sp.]
MKKLFYLLFLPVFLLAQTNEKNKFSVIGLDRMNVVYRGIPNPISIAVNDAKSFKITGDGVSKTKDGKFIIKPGSGNETKIYVEIITKASKKVVEEHIFRIKALPSGFTTINSHGCANKCIVELTYQDLLNATIDYKFDDFLFDYQINVTGFKINFLDYSLNKIGKTIEVRNNKINKETFLEIKKMSNASYIIISDLHFQLKNLDMYVCKVSPVKILISR